MKQLVTLACLLTCFIWSPAQTAEMLVSDVQANLATNSHLKSVLQKNEPYSDHNSGNFRYDKAFLGQTSIVAGFRYVTQPGSGDELIKLVTLRVIHNGEKPGYICISTNIFNPSRTVDIRDSILLKYIDTDYTANILTAYNAKHQTNFTWQELYEDSLNKYQIVPGFQLPRFEDPVTIGGNATTWQMQLFLPFIRNRDHKSIVRNCKSFNPTRQAFGAACLYTLQKKGEPLSNEEKQLLNTIRHSSERSDYAQDCLGKSQVKLSEILTERELDTFFSMTDN